MHDRVEWLVRNHSLDEVFDILDITPYEAIGILLAQGMVTLPPFLELEDGRTFKEQEASNEAQAQYAGESLED